MKERIWECKIRESRKKQNMREIGSIESERVEEYKIRKSKYI